MLDPRNVFLEMSLSHPGSFQRVVFRKDEQTASKQDSVFSSVHFKLPNNKLWLAFITNNKRHYGVAILSVPIRVHDHRNVAFIMPGYKKYNKHRSHFLSRYFVTTLALTISMAVADPKCWKRPS